MTRKALHLLMILPLTAAYITSHSAVPQRRQIEWLKEMTSDICESPPGELTDSMLQQAPQLMRAWSIGRKADRESALAVESLVKRIIDERRAGNKEAMATTEDYNYLMAGWARSRTGVAGAERCEQILTQMQERFEGGDVAVQPDLRSFKSVLMAWTHSGEAYAKYRAQRVLEWMVSLFVENKNEQAMPDADSFDIVLQLWSRSAGTEAPQKAEQLLKAMERLYLATGNESIRPRTSSFNAVLASWAKSGIPGAAERAADILGFMEHLAASGDTAVSPDRASYTAVVGALQRSGTPRSADRAEKILETVERKCDMQGTVCPDTIFYNSVIGCLSRSQQKGAYRRARSILDRQIKLYESGCSQCCPDVYSFTSVIGACAMEQGDDEACKIAFNLALDTFTELKQYDKPSHVTYGSMLKACGRLLRKDDKQRVECAKRIYRECIEDGCVGDMVVARLKEAVPRPVYKELMSGYEKHTIPEAWASNVEEKKNRGRDYPQARKSGEV